MKEDLTENPQKGELNFGEKFNIEQCPENDHLFCPDHDRGDFSTLWRNESV